MAVKRTREHKLKQTQKQTTTYSLGDVQTKSVSLKKGVTPQPKATTKNSSNMFGYSTDFIRQDLLKTVIVTLIVVSVLIGILYFELQ